MGPEFGAAGKGRGALTYIRVEGGIPRSQSRNRIYITDTLIICSGPCCPGGVFIHSRLMHYTLQEHL